MSKASEWSDRLNKRPRITIPALGQYESYPIHANVMDDGRCAIQQGDGTPFCISEEQALELAKWINDTFGESDAQRDL